MPDSTEIRLLRLRTHDLLSLTLPRLLAKKNGSPASPLDMGMFNLGCCVGNDRDENKSSSKVGDLLRVQYFDLLSVLLCFF